MGGKMNNANCAGCIHASSNLEGAKSVCLRYPPKPVMAFGCIEFVQPPATHRCGEYSPHEMNIGPAETKVVKPNDTKGKKGGK